MYQYLSETIISTNRQPGDPRVSSFDYNGELAFVVTSAIGSEESLNQRGFEFSDFGTCYWDTSENFCVVPDDFSLLSDIANGARYVTSKAMETAGL